MDARAVPLLWLALFCPKDILREDGPDEDGEPGLRFAPVAAKEAALAQLDAAVLYLNRVFKDQGPLDEHAALFKKVFGRSKLHFVSIDLMEVAYTDDPDAYYKQLLAALTALEKERPPAAARTVLLALAPLRLKRKFPPARCLLDDSKITRDEEWNMARLFGTEWEEPVPWEPDDGDLEDFSFIQQTSLHTAVERGDMAEVKRLMKVGADPNAPDWRGALSLVEAVKQGPVMVRALLAAGAEPHDVEALFEAVAADQVAVVRLLLEHGADPNARDLHGNPVLVRACEGPERRASRQIVDLLLDAGADINGRGEQTPLVHAVAYNRPQLVEALLRRGADVNLRGKDRSSALSRAKNWPIADERLVMLLRQHGATG
jgi:hypothetical protein